jgi:hypothetical protein
MPITKMVEWLDGYMVELSSHLTIQPFSARPALLFSTTHLIHHV